MADGNFAQIFGDQSACDFITPRRPRMLLGPVMDFRTRPGATIRYSWRILGLEAVDRYLKLGAHYTLDRIVIGVTRLRVYLEEEPGIDFSIEHFENVSPNSRQF